MKMLAGWKLCQRKPMVDPATTAARIPMSNLPRDRAMTANVMALIPHTPAASPSMPSMKLTIFMMAITHSNDTEVDEYGRRHELASELEHGWSIAKVVQSADHDDQRCAQQDTAVGRFRCEQ